MVCDGCKETKAKVLGESLRNDKTWADSAEEVLASACKPIVNSPRVGDCSYEGPAEDMDSFLDTGETTHMEAEEEKWTQDY
ncbi:hypothetical protein EON63_04110 [archaeon]|nr:MAG: hypothetical protein EON63_04110 [archaeon]